MTREYLIKIIHESNIEAYLKYERGEKITGLEYFQILSLTTYREEYNKFINKEVDESLIKEINEILK